MVIRRTRRTPDCGPPLRILAVPDLQVPYHHVNAIANLCAYARTQWYDHVVFIGDLLDLDCLASQNKANLRAVEGKRLAAEFAAGYEVTAEVMDAVRCQNPAASGALCEGNHEFRIHRLMDANPALAGMFDVPSGLRLKELGVEWVPHWSKGAIHEIGPVSFIHGDSHAKNHASVNLRRFNRTIFYGHTHDIDVAFGKDGSGNTIMAQSIGHMCDASKMDWVRGRPVGWEMAHCDINVARWALVPGEPAIGPAWSHHMTRYGNDGAFLDYQGRTWASGA